MQPTRMASQVFPIEFNNLPRKALKKIFDTLPESERQRRRSICQFWKTVIDEECPVSLKITPSNYDRLFKCPNAATVEIHNLICEYTGSVAFGRRVRSIKFTGKVLSSNMCSVLRFCPGLESLSFESLKQVIGIEGGDTVKLPKVTLVEIKVRPDQEVFSSDEIIVIKALRDMSFGTLETILISTLETHYLFDEDPGDLDLSFSEDLQAPSSLTSAATSAFTDADHDGSLSYIVEEPTEGVNFTNPTTPGVDIVSIHEDENTGQTPGSEPTRVTGQTGLPVITVTSDEPPQQPPNSSNMQVIVNRAHNFQAVAEVATSTGHVSSQGSSNQSRVQNAHEFEARVFMANLELIMMTGGGSDDLDTFRESVSRTQLESALYFEITGNSPPAIKHTVFFEFVRNNHLSLKKFIVQTRLDFMCFGNLDTFCRDVPKIQLDEIDYSFGRMNVCHEFPLLRAQRHLVKLKLQIMDDMWKHIAVAVRNSRATISDLDIKVSNYNEVNANGLGLKDCPNLKNLKLIHFYEKGALTRLPVSLNKLFLNGPVLIKDMMEWTQKLLQLADLTLLLNTQGDKISLDMYKRFIKMPCMQKLDFINCPMDLEQIEHYIGNELMERNGITFVIRGAPDIAEMPAIQYVHTSINPDKFNRDQITVN